MRILRFILVKEFTQIFRDKAMLPILFVLPVVQLLVLSHAAVFEVNGLRIAVWDQDRTEESRRLEQAFRANTYFEVVEGVQNEAAANRYLREGRVNAVVMIPRGSGVVHVRIDAVDGYTAGIADAYIRQVVASVWPPAIGPDTRIVSGRFRFNPELDDKRNMVPAILVLLITMLGAFLSAMNIVREREIGTMDQLDVTPITRAHFILGKLIPFWLIGLGMFGIGLTVAWAVFGIVSAGPLPVLFGTAALYLLSVLGLGLWVSSVSDTQHQAMLVAWFLLVVFILMSGLFTPVSSMPEWARHIAQLNPVKWYIDLVRRVMLAGAGWADVLPSVGVLAVFAVAWNSLAWWSMRR